MVARERSPGDDDAEVYERDEDGNVLVPMSILMHEHDIMRRLGRLKRHGVPDVPRDYGAALDMLIDRRLAQLEAKLREMLSAARAEWRALTQAGIATSSDREWGTFLSTLHTEVVRARAALNHQGKP